MHILLVADKPIEATRLNDWLHSGMGPDVVIEHLTTLEPALAKMEANPQEYDVLIVDLVIPPEPAQMAGMTTAQKRAPAMAIIVVSDLSDDDVVQTAIRAGAHEFLVKDSLDPKRLASIIGAVVTARQRWHEGIQRIQQPPTTIEQVAVVTLSTLATELLARQAVGRGMTPTEALEELIQTTADQDASPDVPRSTPPQIPADAEPSHEKLPDPSD